MRVTSLIVLLLLAAGVPKSNAQDGGGLPVGEIPWAAFQFPNVNTPTPLMSPTLTMTLTPSGTLSPTPTGTLTPAYTPNGSVMTPTAPLVPTLNGTSDFLDFESSDLRNQMGTMQAIMNSNSASIINDIGGTPVNLNRVANLAENGSTLLSYIKGLSTLNVGFLTPLVQLLLLNLVISLTMHMLGFLIPLGASLLGLARKAISLILDFIPG